MSLDRIAEQFTELYDKAKIFESLLPKNLQEPDIEIHTGNFYGENKLECIRFTWKKERHHFQVLIYWNDFKLIYNNQETETIDKRRLQMNMDKFIGLIDIYLQLFKLDKE